MKFAAFTALLVSAAALVAASPLPTWDLDHPIALRRSPADPDAAASLDKRIVFSPEITSPRAGDVWTVGETRNATWVTDSIPAELKDATSRLMLGYSPADGEGGLNLRWTLADGFPTTAGTVSFVVPANVTARDDYIVVLFGDSGNKSPLFSIKLSQQTASARDEVEDETLQRESSVEATPESARAEDDGNDDSSANADDEANASASS
ncbi:unnamed protein product [Parajaminaea phylloscopi]